MINCMVLKWVMNLLQPFLEGVELTHKTFVDVVAKFGLKAINPEGEAFNPEFHHRQQ